MTAQALLAKVAWKFRRALRNETGATFTHEENSTAMPGGWTTSRETFEGGAIPGQDIRIDVRSDASPVRCREN